MTQPFIYAQQPMEAVHRCNLCGGRVFWPAHGQDRYGYTVGVLECCSCGLTFLSPRMTAEAYSRFYSDGAYRKLLSKFYGREITAETIEDEQVDYAQRLKKWLSGHVKNMQWKSYLDIGGSTGVVAEILAARFMLVPMIVEPAQAEAARATKRGITTILGGIEDFDPGETRFGLITLCQSVDHLLDIAGTLGRVRGWLMPKAWFFVDFVEHGPIKIDHPYYLTKATMARYLERAGFVVEALEDAGDELHVNVLARPN